MENKTPIVHLPGQAPKLGALGIEIQFLARKAQTNGAWSMIEYTVPAKSPGPPPHYHKAMEEVFYVLEGTLSFLLDGEAITGEAGSFVSIPPGVVHTFSNASDQNARFLLLMSPGGFEGYFEEVAEIVRSEGWPPKDMGRFAALMAKYDTFPVVQ